MNTLPTTLSISVKFINVEEKKETPELEKQPYAICPKCAEIWDIYVCEEEEGKAVLPCGHVIDAGVYELLIVI